MPILGTVGAGSIKSFGGLANLGYFIRNSLRFRSSASGYMNRTPGSASNRKTWTWSGWVKRGSFVQYGGLLTAWSSNDDAGYSVIRFDDDQLLFKNWNTVYRQTSQVFRDPAAWYHIVVALDTTQATAANRVKMYVNGSQITSFATSNDPTQNADFNINNNVLHTLGVNYFSSTPTYFFDGYLAEVNFIDGQALTPSSFGKTDAATNQWIPKKFAGTYGTNGFYLKFADASASTAAAIGKDSSGNGNNWTPNNIGVSTTNTYPLSTITGNTTIIDAENVFDGSLVTQANPDTSTDNFITFTPVTPISYTSSVRVYAYAANGFTITNYYSVNGGGETTFVGGGSGFNGFAWITVASGSGTLNSVKIRLTRGVSGSAAAIAAIEVDGVILTNNFDGTTDSPTLSAVASNFAVLNPLDNPSSSNSLANGNLTPSTAGASGWNGIRSTIAFPITGKWYYEVTLKSGTNNLFLGIVSKDASGVYHDHADTFAVRMSDSDLRPSGATATGTKAGYAVGDIFGVAIDCSTPTVQFYKNGSLNVTYTSPTFDPSKTYFPCFMGNDAGAAATHNFNFGQLPFAYTPPSGYKALNTFNLP